MLYILIKKANLLSVRSCKCSFSIPLKMSIHCLIKLQMITCDWMLGWGRIHVSFSRAPSPIFFRFKKLKKSYIRRCKSGSHFYFSLLNWEVLISVWTITPFLYIIFQKQICEEKSQSPYSRFLCKEIGSQDSISFTYRNEMIVGK